MHQLIRTHRKQILELAAKYGIEEVRVFGSMARGDADGNSDVDLLVSLPEGTSGLVLGGLLMDVQELLKRQTDVVTERALHPLIRQKVLGEAQPL